MPSPADEGGNHDKMASTCREREDYLDWLDNQNRSADDCQSVDHRFLGGWMALSATWLVALMIGVGSLGSLAVVGYCLLTHHLAAH